VRVRACGSAWQVTRMSEQDQAAVIAFLADPASHGGGEVERIDTHASIVFLAGGPADAASMLPGRYQRGRSR